MENNNKIKLNNIINPNLEKVNKFYFNLIFSLLLLLLILLFLYLANVKGFNKYLGVSIFLTLTILIIILGLLNYYNILVKKNSKYKNIYLLISSIFSIGLIFLFIYNIGIFNIQSSKFNTNLVINYLIFIIFLGLAIFYNYKNYKSINNEKLTNEENLVNNERIKFSIIFIVYILLILGLYIYNPYGLFTKYSGITILGILFIGLVLFSMIIIYNYYFSNINKLRNIEEIPKITNFLKFIYIIIGLFVSGLLFYFFLYLLGAFNQDETKGISYYILNTIILLGILTILYKLIFAGGLLNKNPLYRLIINTILFIPCLLNNLINNLQSKITLDKVKIDKTNLRNDLFFLILIIILIVLYFILSNLIIPLIKKYYIIRNGKQYIDEPIELNEKKVIASYEELNGNINSKYSYGMSFWIYIDSFANQKLSNILDYGGIPLIQYNGLTNSLLILVKNKNNYKLIYKKDKFKLQKWHNIVINYNNGTLDIFLNNELIGASINVVSYSNYDSLIVGENNGNFVNMCNLVYYKNPISIFEINNIYVNLKSKNPPNINN